MLVVSRKIGQRIFIGDNIVVTLVDVDRGKVRIGVEAPNDVRILREELLDRPSNEDQPPQQR
jgi:carbon storage regulator